MTSSLRRVHLLQSTSPSEQQIQMPRECPGTQVKCNTGVKQNREGKTEGTLVSKKKGSFIPILEKAMAPHFSSLAWKIPRTEEPGRLQSTGLLRVRHD